MTATACYACTDFSCSLYLNLVYCRYLLWLDGVTSMILEP